MPRPFTSSQAQKHQRMQGLFMKLDVLELLLMPNEGIYALKIACGGEGEAGDEAVTFGDVSKLSDPPN